jgi:hypothetical protein
MTEYKITMSQYFLIHLPVLHAPYRFNIYHSPRMVQIIKI